MESAKDLVFPSRVLKRQLEDAQHRLKEMEEELETIKNQEQRERKRRKKTRVCSTIHTPNCLCVVRVMQSCTYRRSGNYRC